MSDQFDVGSPDDPASAVVMCRLYSRPLVSEDVPDPLWSYRPLAVAGGRAVVPLPCEYHWSATQLVEAAEPRFLHIPAGAECPRVELDIRRFTDLVCDDRAEDVRFAPLLVGGPRTFEYDGATWQCYMMWRPSTGRPVLGRDRYSTMDSAISREVMRQSVGCLYARMRQRDYDGRPDGYKTMVLSIEAVLEHGPPDDFHLSLFGMVFGHHAAGQEISLPPGRSRKREVWQEVYALARQRFGEQCSSDPVDGKTANAELPTSERDGAFVAQIQGLAWEEALEQVEEAWQLTLVCLTHQPAQFAHSGTPYKQAHRMVESYSGARPERARLLRILWLETGPALQ